MSKKKSQNKLENSVNDMIMNLQYKKLGREEAKAKFMLTGVILWLGWFKCLSYKVELKGKLTV